MLAESKLLARVFLSNLKRLDYPYKLSFAMTYRCNLRCKMCLIWKKEKLPELTTKEIESFFKRSNRFSWVGLTGGEIFMRDDLPQIAEVILKHCKDLCILHFPTNGYLTGKIDAQVKEILRLKPRRLITTISLDGPPQIHDHLRGVDGSWKHAMDTFITLRQRPGVGAYLSMTLGAENLGLIDETIHSIKSVYPEFNAEKMMNFNIFHQSSHYFENAHMAPPDPNLLLQSVKQALKIVGGGAIKNYLQKNYLKLCEPYLRTGRSPLPCQALSASCLINPYGEVFPCGVYDNKVGNIRNYDFDLGKLWNEKSTGELRLACKNGRCPGCWTPCDAYQSINGAWLKSLTSYGAKSKSAAAP